MISPNMLNLKSSLTICLRAMSSDFLDIVLPKPVLSVDEAGLVGLPTAVDFWISGSLTSCPLLRDLSFGELSKCLPRFKPIEAAASEFGFAWTVNGTPGRCLPAEMGLSGSFVLRFG